MQAKRFPVVSGAALAIFLTTFAITTWSSTHEKLLPSLNPDGPDGAFPEAALVADGSGNFYGTTYNGGPYNVGTVFELSPREGGRRTEKVLYSFKSNGRDGNFPYAGLIFDTHGNLYGTTYQGGANNGGTVFLLEPHSGGSWTESVLYSFCAQTYCADGSYPSAGLIFDAHGNLYSTTSSGGTIGLGTVFELSPRRGGGWTETVLYSFNPNGTDGLFPIASLIFDAAGDLYGTTLDGGTNNDGTVFELSPNGQGGWTEAVIYSFCAQANCTDGSYPYYAGLVIDTAGNLYGTTHEGGTYNDGTAFELSPAHGGGWTEAVLHSFGHGTDGTNPSAGTLIRDTGGNLYGTTPNGGAYGFGAVFELSPRQGGGWSEAVLYSFKVNGTDGWLPYAGLIRDHSGNLYGTTANGGSKSDGTVFELERGQDGGYTESVLYSFSFAGTDGAIPIYGALLLDGDGNLYGTTSEGGIFDSGAAFELTPNENGSWTEELLYSFGSGADASVPETGPITDASGNGYGTTAGGGLYNKGAVFELSPSSGGGWSEKVLHSFGHGADGYYPYAGLVFDAYGNLYGTTPYGGAYGQGTVFQLKPNGSGGWTETVLYSFYPNGTDGFLPFAGLVIDSAGNLYGTTFYGGNDYSGTVFEVSPNGHGGWTENVLYSFCGQTNCANGGDPYGGLVFDAAHNLYGTTTYGGANGQGVVFQLTQRFNWTENVLYSFCAQTNCADGSSPYGTLTFFGSSSDLYGTTYAGGTYNSGTVFKLTPTQEGNWTDTVLHSFNPQGGDGSFPESSLIFDPSGNIYGTTTAGGGTYNSGAVFELTPTQGGNWTETVLHGFNPEGGATTTPPRLMPPTLLVP
jgi:uncharacterized repeat protein (TIGR03803 family)